MPERSSGLAPAAPWSLSRARRASSPRGNISGEWDEGTQTVVQSPHLLCLFCSAGNRSIFEPVHLQ